MSEGVDFWVNRLDALANGVEQFRRRALFLPHPLGQAYSVVFVVSGRQSGAGHVPSRERNQRRRGDPKTRGGGPPEHFAAIDRMFASRHRISLARCNRCSIMNSVAEQFVMTIAKAGLN